MSQRNMAPTKRACRVVGMTDKKSVAKIKDCDCTRKATNSFLRECVHVCYLYSVIRKSLFLKAFWEYSDN